MSDTLRAPLDEDAPRVAQLMSEGSPDPVSSEGVLVAWTSPGLERDADVRLGPECYALVQSLDGERVWLDVHGRTDAALLDWAEERATEKGAHRLFSGAWSENAAQVAVLEARGFRLVRHSYRMKIDLGTELASSSWPDGIHVRSFEPGDERVFHDVHEETFEDVWENVPMSFEQWAHVFLESPRFVPDLWLLVLEGDEPAGIAIAYPHLGNPELGWIGSLGVRRPWRRLGIGKALLLHAFGEFKKRGLTEAGLGVDAESLTGAHRLYESAGMSVEHRFDFYEKSL